MAVEEAAITARRLLAESLSAAAPDTRFPLPPLAVSVVKLALAASGESSEHAGAAGAALAGDRFDRTK